MKKKISKKFILTLPTFILALALAAIFIFLGFWQLDSAREVKSRQIPFQERPLTLLSKLAKPGANLSEDAINRLVTFSGRYGIQLIAPNQLNGKNEIGDWLVGLLEVENGGAILVVRSSSSADQPRGDITVEGRLFPRQFDDRSTKSEGQLSRLDPALVSALYPIELYDGFVVASQEIVDGQEITLPRVFLEPAKPTTPGNYWQHISYFIIWLLMAAVVLFLPFYQRSRKESP
jgi:cytochrome oxidase assembly protein ShyY1